MRKSVSVGRSRLPQAERGRSVCTDEVQVGCRVRKNCRKRLKIYTHRTGAALVPLSPTSKERTQVGRFGSRGRWCTMFGQLRACNSDLPAKLPDSGHYKRVRCFMRSTPDREHHAAGLHKLTHSSGEC